MKKSLLRLTSLVGLQTKDLICDFCGKAFGSKAILSTHRKWHNEEYRNRFKCQYCAYANSRANRLREHLSKHHKLEQISKT